MYSNARSRLQEPEACPAHAHAIDLARLIGADALAGGFYAGMLTQGGQGGPGSLGLSIA